MQFDLNSADGTQEIEFRRAAKDAFGRLRISTPETLISISYANGSHDLLHNAITSDGGSIAYNSSSSSVRLSVPTTSGASAIRATRRYVRYNPGRSYLFTFALNVGAKKANVRKRWGAFDDLNGCFFEDNGTNLCVVVRTNASGSAVDTAIPQSSWNIDKLDGTGESGITLDQTKHQLWVIDHIWHDAGPVRFGVHINGEIRYVHEIVSGNVSTSHFVRSPIFPLRYEIVNTGTAASDTSIDCACVTATIENGHSDLVSTYSFSGSNGTKAKIVSKNVYTPLLSIRPKLTLNGNIFRGPVFPESLDVATAAAFLHIQLVLSPTLTGASFASVNASSGVEIDTSATASSGGTVLYETYATSGSGKASAFIGAAIDQFVLGLDIAGNTADILTVQARATVNNQATYASLKWKEFQ